MSIKDVDLNDPWYCAREWPLLGDAHAGSHMATQGMVMRAAAGAPPCQSLRMSGNIVPGTTREQYYQKVDAWAAERGFRLVLHEPPLHEKDECLRTYFSREACLVANFNDEVNGEVNVTCCSADLVSEAQVFFRSLLSSETPQGKVYVMVQREDGISFSGIGIGGVPLEKSNYSQEVLDGYNRALEDIESVTPGGRVTVISGTPGGGKSYLVRGLLNEVSKAIFIIVQPSMLYRLTDPSVIPSLINLRRNLGVKPIVIILEDADSVLAPRAADNMASISTILNFGDGILGSLLDVRIVATTNAEKAELDEAIIRPGRLSSHIEIEALSFEHSKEVYRRLTGKTDLAKGEYTLAEIYAMGRDNGWKPAAAQRKSMGFSNPFESLDLDE